MPNMPLVQQLAALQDRGTTGDPNKLDYEGAKTTSDSLVKILAHMDKLKGLIVKAEARADEDGKLRLYEVWKHFGKLADQMERDLPAEPESESGVRYEAQAEIPERQLGQAPPYPTGPEPDLSVMQRLQNALSGGHPFVTPEYTEWEYNKRRQEEELKTFLESLGK